MFIDQPGRQGGTDETGKAASQSATHPYCDLPQRAIWRSAVADRHALRLEHLYRRKFEIAPGAAIATAGSCFAQYIGHALQNGGFNFRNVEPAPPLLPARLAKSFNYGVYSARYCNIYTARQLIQLFARAFGEFTPQEAAWEKDGGFVDPFRPMLEPEPFGSVEELERSRRSHLEAVRHLFETTDVFIFTLGLTEAWISKSDGAVFPLCPGTAGGLFREDAHAFKNFNYFEIFEDLVAFMTRVHQVNNRVRFVFTVSPVPLTATKSDNHVLAATTYSKSVLRAVAGHLASEIDFVDYFPAYELIAAPSMRGMFYEPNLRTVTPAGVEHVMGHFFAEHGKTAAAAPKAATSTGDKSALVGDLEVVCEEMMQAQGLGYA